MTSAPSFLRKWRSVVMVTTPPHSQNEGMKVAMPSPLEICSCELLEFRMLESSLVAPLLF